MARVNMRYLLAVAIIIMRRRRRRRKDEIEKQKRARRCWVSSLNQERELLGAFYSTVLPARIQDRFFFFKYLRISPERFDHLLQLVRPPIPPNERLAATLRYLASGDTKQSISFQFKLGKSTVSGIIDEVCEAIWDALSDYVKAPKTLEEWMKIAQEFEDIWNMPHCIGAIGGKHIAMRHPKFSGSLWHNYKGFFSLVLLAICDARYCFSFVGVGNYGGNNDILLNSDIVHLLREGKLNIPNKSKNTRQ